MTPDPAAVETVMRVQRDHAIVAVGRMGYGCRRYTCRVTGTQCDVEAHVAREVVAALDLDARDRAAEKRGAVKGLRSFADEHVKNQSAGRIWEDLHAEADRIEAES